MNQTKLKNYYIFVIANSLMSSMDNSNSQIWHNPSAQEQITKEKHKEITIYSIPLHIEIYNYISMMLFIQCIIECFVCMWYIIKYYSGIKI